MHDFAYTDTAPHGPAPPPRSAWHRRRPAGSFRAQARSSTWTCVPKFLAPARTAAGLSRPAESGPVPRRD